MSRSGNIQYKLLVYVTKKSIEAGGSEEAQ